MENGKWKIENGKLKIVSYTERRILVPVTGTSNTVSL